MANEDDIKPSELNDEVEKMKQLSNASIGDIAVNILDNLDENEEVTLPAPERAPVAPEDLDATPVVPDPLPDAKSPDIPIGDGFTDTPPAPPTVDELLQSVDNLDKDIEEQSLEDSAGSKTKASFEGLKSKYKSTISEVKGQLELLKQEKDLLVKEASNYSKAKEELEAAKVTLAALEEERDKFKQDAASSRHFRLKYDAENDPIIKEAFTAPMNSSLSKARDIITDAGLEPGFWNELVAAENSAQVNRLIDSTDMTRLNAVDLKAHVEQYKTLKSEFDTITSPEFIEATITKAKGQQIQRSESQAKQIFDDLTSHYSEHIAWLKESKTNKDHNIYIHDQAVENANKNFQSFRKRLSAENQSEEVLSWAAHTSLAAAAYPFQDKYARHLEKRVKELETALASRDASPKIKQTSEPKPQVDSFMSEIDKIKEAAKLPMKDIASTVFID